MILAMETSQRDGSVAIRDARGRVHEQALHEPARFDDDLLPAIDRLLAGCSIRPRDLGAVAVSIGPGGFTGLRIAVSAAKMMGESLGIPLVAVPSALVAAEAYRAQRAESGTGGGTILVALASKRETAWITRVELDMPAAGIKSPRAADDSATSAQRGAREAGLRSDATLELRGVDAMLADEHLPEAMRRACERAHVPILPPQFSAAACLAVAQRMLDAGLVTDAVHLLPLYPREPEAATIWRERHAGAAQPLSVASPVPPPVPPSGSHAPHAKSESTRPM
jgi:tRNA threonylcarbamoyladenosine biosynthesis protein TsaB